MLLFVSLIALVVVVVVSAPATANIRQGKQQYMERKYKNDEYFRRKAQEHDTYFVPGLFGTNENFYNDGSLRYDVTTGKHFAKSQYFCRADGITADYSKAADDVERPPK